MSDRLLTALETREAVEKLVDSPNQNMNEVRGILSKSLSGSTVVVLGSAPGAILPPRGHYDRLVCVNGSGSVAMRYGLTPDATVIVGYLTGTDKGVSPASRKVLAGCFTDFLVFVSAGQKFEDGLATLQSSGFGYQRVREIDPLERAAIVETVCGQSLGLGPRDERVSNGMFATALAIWAGASRVILAGFSLQGGHSYLEGTPRYHIDGDQRFLQTVNHEAGNLYTTSSELSAAIGLTLLKVPPEVL